MDNPLGFTEHQCRDVLEQSDSLAKALLTLGLHKSTWAGRPADSDEDGVRRPVPASQSYYGPAGSNGSHGPTEPQHRGDASHGRTETATKGGDNHGVSPKTT